jgi:hypothetical protein
MKMSGLRGHRAWLRIRRVVKEGERGATAVVVALSLVLLMAAGAFGFDVAKLYYERQQLRNAIDAAAQAGASALPATSSAEALAIQYGNLNFPGLNLTASDISFFCVVKNAAGTAAGGYPDPLQVGASRTCEGKPGWTNADAKCSDTSCAIPCNAGQSCNSMQIRKSRTVDFVFGPAIDIPSASTGLVQTLSCNGPCGGTPPPNPMDVVVIADRTSSMSSGNVAAMISGIRGMMQQMNPEQQYISIGTIHKGPGTDSADPTGAQTTPLTYAYADTGATSKTFRGSWIATGFSNTYRADNEAVSLNESDPVVAAVKNIDRDAGIYGTHLAAPLKAATRFLLGRGSGTKWGTTSYYNSSTRKNVTAPQAYDPASNVGSLPDRTEKFGVAKKVIIFETDGEPNEQFNSDSGALTGYKSNAYDISNTSDKTACANFADMATRAKADGITILTIATGNAATSSNYCWSNSKSDRKLTRDVLAAAASPINGKNAVASDCTIKDSRGDRKSTRLNSSHNSESRMPSSA